jgi:hypothetical protein
MRPRDWFSVGVRLFGIYFFYRGFADLLTFGAYNMQIIPHVSSLRELGEGNPGNYYLWFAAGYLAMAIYCVFYAEHLTRWAFKENNETDDYTNPDASEI